MSSTLPNMFSFHHLLQDKKTALHYASELGMVGVVDLLLQNGAAVDAKDVVCYH